MTQFEKIERERRYADLDRWLEQLASIAPPEWRDRLLAIQIEVMDEWHTVANHRAVSNTAS